jgi:hypothetical protein
MSKTYKVLQSVTYGEWVQVQANSKDEAEDKVQNGDWFDEDVIDSEIIIRETTGDVEEM